MISSKSQARDPIHLPRTSLSLSPTINPASAFLVEKLAEITSTRPNTPPSNVSVAVAHDQPCECLPRGEARSGEVSSLSKALKYLHLSSFAWFRYLGLSLSVTVLLRSHLQSAGVYLHNFSHVSLLDSLSTISLFTTRFYAFYCHHY